MTDKKISLLGATTTPVDADIMPIVVDVATTPVTKKVTWANIKATLKTYLDGLYPKINGWEPDSATWTYASATTLTISGDVTVKFPVGTKIKLTQTTVKYFYVVAASYSSPNTTLTLAAGSDYSLANAAITSPYYSYMLTPQGFPKNFNFTPSFSSFTVGNGSVYGLFSMLGSGVIKIRAGFVMGSTSSVSGLIQLTPFIGTIHSSYRLLDKIGGGVAIHSGTSYGVYFSRQGYVFTEGTLNSLANTSATNPFTWANGDELSVDGEYFIA